MWARTEGAGEARKHFCVMEKLHGIAEMIDEVKKHVGQGARIVATDIVLPGIVCVLRGGRGRHRLVVLLSILPTLACA